MKKLLLLICSFSFCIYAQSQIISEEDVFRKIDSKFSPEEAAKVRKEYKEANDTTKAIMLNVFSMPMSSKKELIDNLERNRNSIIELQKAYEKLIPKDFIVFLELKTSDKIAGLVEGIDFQVFRKNANGEDDMVDGDWGLQYGSDELDRLLALVDWDRMTLLAVKNLLQTANCISIKNGDITEVGFARSGLGMYYYLLFPRKLSKSQMNDYNDGCEYLYYKDNVVLKYIGGMAGPQCFTD
ncbi:MAG TPA: hypothetical protein DIT04_09190 [Dysgonomonas sp.]|nr:hypothetical protein [Dysgonomonas sp.]